MNFLEIIQVSVIYFVLKIILQIDFSVLLIVRTARQKQRNAGARVQELPDHNPSMWSAGSISQFARGAYARLHGRKGIAQSEPPDLTCAPQIISTS
jgi:hypothetical protein